LRRIVGVSVNGVLAGEGVFNGERRAFLAIPSTLIVESPAPEPEEPSVLRERRQRHHAQALERWRGQQARYQDKVARWEEQVRVCKAAHGR
jgi:hypothetical protein